MKNSKWKQKFYVCNKEMQMKMQMQFLESKENLMVAYELICTMIEAVYTSFDRSKPVYMPLTKETSIGLFSSKENAMMCIVDISGIKKCVKEVFAPDLIIFEDGSTLKALEHDANSLYVIYNIPTDEENVFYQYVILERYVN